MPAHGSRADLALRRARKILAKRQGKNARAILLVTDGDFDDTTKAAVEAELVKLGQAGINLFVLGTGTSDGGGMQTEDGLWLKVNGKPVFSRLDDALLQRIARKGGGRYTRTTLDNSEWKKLYRDGIARLASYRISKNGRQQIKWKELFGWALVPALLLLALLLFPKDGRSANTAAMFVLALTGLSLPHPADASETERVERQAFKAYQAGNYRRASALYQQVPGYRGKLGRGSSRYMRGDYRLAARHFAAAVIAAQSRQQRATALFNLGNAWFKLANYPAAAESYRDALRYRTVFPQARKNLAFTRELIREVNRRRRRMARILGRGRPGFRRRLDGSDNNGQGSYGLDEKPIDKKLLSARYGIRPEQLSKLIARGLKVARLADSGRAVNGRQAATSPLHLESIRARMLQLTDQGKNMIKSLLELEAGYPAPLTKTEKLPGVRPW
jgi:tetratricopeptide (TPR) repeat protein